MVNKDFCLSSYIAFRYIWKDGVDFAEGFRHANFLPVPDSERIPVRSAEEIDREIRRQFDALYAKYDRIGILLSGGMDSANLSSYLHPGSHAYTFTAPGSQIFNKDLERAADYCRKWGLQHHLIEITFEDYEQYTPEVIRHKFAPVHSIEPQIYKAALQAKQDGVQLMIVGESADLIFGGMDKLISPQWTFDGFAARYTYFMRFMDEVFAIESSGSYMNAFGAAWMPYYDPYAVLVMTDPLDMERVRGGEPKYLVRELYAMKYPEREIPFKIPMPRPVDTVFQDWAGPSRPEFRQDIPMERLTGNQKWQLWCAELFLNMLDR